MNGPHDMGGFTGFGPVVSEADEPVWHAPWEQRTFALTLAMGMTGHWTVDAARHARERLPAMHYWRSSDHAMRHDALLLQLVERGLVTSEEVAQGQMQGAPRPVARVATAEMVPGILAAGGPSARSTDRPQVFALGDAVRVRTLNPTGHTRLPRYARGKRGTVVSVHAAHVFSDANAHDQGEDPHWLYTVRCDAQDLWGKPARDAVMIDLWEPYLERLG